LLAAIEGVFLTGGGVWGAVAGGGETETGGGVMIIVLEHPDMTKIITIENENKKSRRFIILS